MTSTSCGSSKIEPNHWCETVRKVRSFRGFDGHSSISSWYYPRQHRKITSGRSRENECEKENEFEKHLSRISRANSQQSRRKRRNDQGNRVKLKTVFIAINQWFSTLGSRLPEASWFIFGGVASWYFCTQLHYICFIWVFAGGFLGCGLVWVAVQKRLETTAIDNAYYYPEPITDVCKSFLAMPLSQVAVEELFSAWILVLSVRRAL